MFELLAQEANLSPRRLYRRIWHLREFIDLSAGAADEYLLARATASLDRVEERAQLGAEFTVAALVGGTGSGKSTLFNSLTDLDFADDGEIRPTTERAAACTWKAKADGLLDHLNVDTDRRIEHGSILTPVPDELEGLILLDLPDFDSVKFTNSLTVTRLMPMLDVLIWVVDPQKYADQLLHRDYLQNLRGRSRQMIVVMNHIDTVIPAQVPELMANLRQLLDADGLANVPAYPISALEKTGLEPLQAHLRKALATPSMNLITAAAQVDEVGRLLEGTVGFLETKLVDFAVAKTEVVQQLMRASGVPTVIEQISRAADKLSGAAFAAPIQPAPSLLGAIRDGWIAQANTGLPQRWAKLGETAVAPLERIRRQVGKVYESVVLPQISQKPLWIGVIFALVIFVAGVLAAIFAVPDLALIARVGVCAVGVVLAGTIYLFARYWVRKTARRAARKYEAQLVDQLGLVVQEQLIDGLAAVRAKYSRAVDLLNR
ncbi:GTP-binding protein [Arcanobacterium hippocoleae]|uniref:GTP-binding protein EngB required for normal cell division n=1 Tax=Arcanobacterium hippocoleae TaxID=149017 RepID=A0ABU1T1C4_9ACTO|nr:GTP-binding protein [Arcanobacterium hippocoleae]MDR6939164.1 GTP-binding protein EngB required for normal cell division [Arcanobacterium hippocoleae]